MDLKNLLGKLYVIEGTMASAEKHPTGPDFTGYWKGTDKRTPGKHMVGGAEQQESMLKDLSKGPTAKSKEQELSEEYQAFLEAEFKDTVDKRPARKNARPARGHEPKLGYKTIKADESSMSEKDIELQDYRSMSHKEFQTAYGMTKTEWMNKNKALVIRNPDIKKSLGLEEGSDHGPVEARWMVTVSDDEGQHLKTFRDEFPNLAAAKKAYEKHKPYASDFKYTSVKKDQVEEAVYTAPKNKEEYDAKMAALQDLQMDPNTANNEELQRKIIIYMDNLQKVAHQHGWLSQPTEESRGHNIIATKLKNLERERKFAKGELKIPTPQERQAQLKKLEKEPKQVKEYGANTVSPYGQPVVPKVDPKQAQQVAANLNIQKTALNQLKQINPQIDAQKAATAMTKDPATMTPQEKEELAQVAKTVGPALGTPAFGSIKTAIQKSQLQAKK